MTPEEREREILEELERRMRGMGVVTTAHYDACAGLIAAAIRAAVAAEREACARAVERTPTPFGGLASVRAQIAAAIRARGGPAG